MRAYTFDAAMRLKLPGTVAASAPALANGSSPSIDLGSDTANFSAVAVFDVSAIEVASGDERYDLIVQGSNTPDFSGAIENLAQVSLGAAAARDAGAITSTIGRYEAPFVNRRADVIYRYLRHYTKVSGSVATGITFRSFIGRSSVAAM